MKRLVSVAALLSSLLWSIPFAPSASAQPASGPAPTLIEIAYLEPANPKLRPVYERLKKRQVLEQLQQFLSPLRLPRKLTVRTEQCNAPSRDYKPGGPVIVCYEHVQRVERLATKQQSPSSAPREVMIVGAFIQGVLHNVAHAVYDLLELPVWGRANDAADQLAAFIMLQFGQQVAKTAIFGTAWFFEASGRTWTGSDFADVASPEAQRAYNFMCIAYGSDPTTFKFLVDNDLLPKRRAERCAGEHFEVEFAFGNLILPHVDLEVMKQVQAMEILKPGDIGQPAAKTESSARQKGQGQRNGGPRR